MTISALWFFLMVHQVGLQCVIVVFPDQTHLFHQKKYHLHLTIIHSINYQYTALGPPQWLRLLSTLRWRFVVVDLLLIVALSEGFYVCCYMFCCALLCVLSSFAIILSS